MKSEFENVASTPVESVARNQRVKFTVADFAVVAPLISGAAGAGRPSTDIANCRLHIANLGEESGHHEVANRQLEIGNRK
jgi:hypothetical protein